MRVNDFECARDEREGKIQLNERFDTLTFDDESNQEYVYESMDDLLANPKDLREMIQHFLEVQKPRLEILEGYSKGHNHTILTGRRRLNEGKADHRISHNWGGYISHFTTGFIASIPIDISADNDQQQNELDSISTFNDLDNLNQELIFDTSRVGRAYELHRRNEDGFDCIHLIDFKEMFVIREKTVERGIIGAVHVPIYGDELDITVYTDSEIIQYAPTKESQVQLNEANRRKHLYGDVPVVEWKNNRFREGDWENEIGLFDAYDSAQSDTANYMSDLNDAALVIKGDLQNSGLAPEDLYLMSQANIFLLQSGTTVDGKQTSVDADYVHKKYDVDGTEAYKKRLLDDIYKLVNVPNIDDDKFGSQSGIAIQYKLIGLQQLKATKVSYYTKALRRRYKLIAGIHKELNGIPFDPMAITFTFHENLPQDVWEEVEHFRASGGELSQETLAELTSFTDYKQEQERLESEEFERSVPFMTDSEMRDSQWQGLGSEQ